MTPSAARGILEPSIGTADVYLIDSIRVVKRGRWISIRRNEVTRVISIDSAKSWMHSPEKIPPFQSRWRSRGRHSAHMLALQDVEILITAEVRLTHSPNPRATTLPNASGRSKAAPKLENVFIARASGCAICRDFDWEPEPRRRARRRATNSSNLPPSTSPRPHALRLFDHRAAPLVSAG